MDDGKLLGFGQEQRHAGIIRHSSDAAFGSGSMPAIDGVRRTPSAIRPLSTQAAFDCRA